MKETLQHLMFADAQRAVLFGIFTALPTPLNFARGNFRHLP